MRAILVAAIFLATTSATRAQEAATPACQPGRLSSLCQQTVYLSPNFISTLTIDKPFKTVLVGNPGIVQATAHSDRMVVLTPQDVGETNIIFLDEGNVQISNINVQVGPAFVRVKIHNKALLTSFTAYRCDKIRCEYVDEVTAKEPAPLPRGYGSQTYNENINSTNQNINSTNTPPPQ
jgi:hypothetical protein